MYSSQGRYDRSWRTDGKRATSQQPIQANHSNAIVRQSSSKAEDNGHRLHQLALNVLAFRVARVNTATKRMQMHAESGANFTLQKHGQKISGTDLVPFALLPPLVHV